MTKHRTLEVGMIFDVKPAGIKVTVKEYVNAKNVLVIDAQGYERTVTAKDLWDGNVTWLTKSGAVRKASKRLGLKQPTKRAKMISRFPIGSTWESSRHGKFTIVAVKSSLNVTIKWESSGSLQENVQTSAIVKGSVINKVDVEVKDPEGIYVYSVTLQGKVVYVGMGQGKRWRHCFSGKSGNRELNRLYFSKAPVIVEIISQNLSRSDAKVLERRLISEHRPACNEIIYAI